MRDPKSGQVRDVIINELKPFNIVRDKPTKRVTWHRVVPGLNIEIPWPQAFEDAERRELEQVLDEHECDTLRADVEDRTFVPSLLSPGMPTEIIDELRNKYSKFRTRHEPEYIARKEEEAAVKTTNQLKLLTMQTPLQEFNAAIRAERKALGEPVLSDAMLEKIGELMFRAQQAKNGVEVEAGTDETPVKVVRLDQAERQKRLENRLRYMSKKNREKEMDNLKKNGRWPWKSTPEATNLEVTIPGATTSEVATPPPS